jgi:hypothetical protein
MNTSSSSLDARSLAHRLNAVGHALHHRLFEQLRASDLDPRTIAILSVIDGRLDAPWVSDRIARGGKRVAALAERGWITRVDEAWSLTDEGRAILDRVDADRASILADLPTDELAQLSASLEAVANALGVDATDSGPRGFRGGRGGFGPSFGRGSGRGFGPGSGRGFGPGFGPGFRGDDDRAGFEHGERAERGHGQHGHGRHTDGARFERGEHDHGRHGAHHDGGHRGHRAAQRAFERGFDAGFARGREATASGASSASE